MAISQWQSMKIKGDGPSGRSPVEPRHTWQSLAINGDQGRWPVWSLTKVRRKSARLRRSLRKAILPMHRRTERCIVSTAARSLSDLASALLRACCWARSCFSPISASARRIASARRCARSSASAWRFSMSFAFTASAKELPPLPSCSRLR